MLERLFSWIARFRRLAHDYKWLPENLAELYLVALVILLLRRAAELVV